MLSVIIVDDELKIREGLENLFPWKNIGFQVVGSFPSAKYALEYVSKHEVDVVLSDIRMPEMDGIVMAGMIRQAKPETKVVFLTGYNDYEYMRSAIQVNACDYLMKPVKYEELVLCFEQIKKTLSSEGVVKENVQEDYYSRITYSVKAYVNENLKSANLESIALKINLSSGHLSTIFKNQEGITFSEYVYKQRMDEGKHLLDDISLKNYEIAEILGYDNPKNFSRAFKQFYGVSPREYRAGKVVI